MSNMIGYLANEAGASFLTEPFNEVDSLIFSQLAYFDFPVAHSNTPVTLASCLTENWVEEMAPRTGGEGNNRLLFAQLRDNPRFGPVEVCQQESITSHVDEQQFAAVTFKIAPATYYVAFRGTNGSFVGWKEDLNMAYLDVIPSQTSAQVYFATTASRFPGQYYLGGHSKGGNLAVYAATFAPPALQADILTVFSHDGPGLNAKLSQSAAYDEIRLKVAKTLPTFSLIGVLLEEEQSFKVIRSNAKSWQQHDLYTWQVAGGTLLAAEKASFFTTHAQQTFRSWLASLDAGTLERCLASLYVVGDSMGVEYLAEALALWPDNARLVLAGLKNTSPEVRESWRYLVKTLLKTTVKEGLQLMKNDTQTPAGE